MKRKQEKYDRIAGKHHLKIMETSVCGIPERLEDYDSGLFLVFNCQTQKYEVHSLGNTENTYCFAVPHDELDARAISTVERNDTKKRRIKDIVAEMDAKNEALDRNEARRRRDDVKAIAVEMRPAFKKLAEEVY